jgi:hypothetical protein
MSLDPDFLANIKTFEPLDEEDRVALAKVVEYRNGVRSLR